MMLLRWRPSAGGEEGMRGMSEVGKEAVDSCFGRVQLACSGGEMRGPCWTAQMEVRWRIQRVMSLRWIFGVGVLGRSFGSWWAWIVIGKGWLMVPAPLADTSMSKSIFGKWSVLNGFRPRRSFIEVLGRWKDDRSDGGRRSRLWCVIR